MGGPSPRPGVSGVIDLDRSRRARHIAPPNGRCGRFSRRRGGTVGPDRLAMNDKTPHDTISHDKILIVDFGSQVTQLIARRVREDKVYCEIVPFQKAEAAFMAMRPKAVILSGGPASVHETDAPLAPPAIFEAGVPVLGICYGEQAMAQQL